MDEELISISLDPIDEIRRSKYTVSKVSNEAANKEPIERILLLLSKGDDKDKMIAVNFLPEVIKYSEQDFFSKIIPKIVGILPTASVEFQIGISKFFCILVDRNLSVQKLYNSAIAGLRHMETSVVNAWADALIVSIPSLNPTDVQHQILPQILRQTDTFSISKKIELIRLIGVCCPIIDSHIINKSVLPVIFEFSSDSVAEVRGITCLQFPQIAKSIGIAQATGLLPYIEKFCKDSNPIVQGSALTIIGQMKPFFAQNVLKKKIIPLAIDIVNVCLIASEDTKIILAKSISSFCESMAPLFEPIEKIFLIDCYNELTRCGLSEIEMRSIDASRSVACRQQCAINLASMISFIHNFHIPQHQETIYIIIRALAMDPCFGVRKVTASRFHTIVVALGPAVGGIKDVFFQLLRDPSGEVCFNLVCHLHDILKQFFIFNVLHNRMDARNVAEFLKPLLACQTTVIKSRNWRLKVIYINQLEFLPFVLPFECVYAHFWNPLLSVMTAPGMSRPVRQQAGRTSLQFLRSCGNEGKRRNFRSRLIKDIARNNSAYIRIIFLSICQDCLDLFSIQYFNEHFAPTFISFLGDKVSNIRYVTLSILPKFKKLLKFTQSLNMETLLDDHLKRRFQQEDDHDCRKILSHILIEMTNISREDFNDRDCEIKNRQLYQEEKDKNIFS